MDDKESSCSMHFGIITIQFDIPLLKEKQSWQFNGSFKHRLVSAESLTYGIAIRPNYLTDRQ